MIENAGFEAVERDTVYNRLEKVGIEKYSYGLLHALYFN